MTVDIRFALDESDPHAQRALKVLYALEQQGYDVPDVMTRALIALGDGGAPHDHTSALVASVKDILRQMRDLLAEMRASGLVAPASPAEQRAAKALDEDTSPLETVELSQSFLTAVKKAARPGLRLEG